MLWAANNIYCTDTRISFLSALLKRTSFSKKFKFITFLVVTIWPPYLIRILWLLLYGFHSFYKALTFWDSMIESKFKLSWNTDQGVIYVRTVFRPIIMRHAYNNMFVGMYVWIIIFFSKCNWNLNIFFWRWELVSYLWDITKK